MRYRPTMKTFFIIFLFVCFGLGWCGGQLPDAPVIGSFKTFVLFDGDLNSYLWLTRFLTAYYFIFFLVLMPLVGLREKPLPVPATISEPVLSGDAEQKG
ncbi:Cytochrome b/c1 [compost metagenome]